MAAVDGVRDHHVVAQRPLDAQPAVQPAVEERVGDAAVDERLGLDAAAGPVVLDAQVEPVVAAEQPAQAVDQHGLAFRRPVPQRVAVADQPPGTADVGEADTGRTHWGAPTYSFRSNLSQTPARAVDNDRVH